MRDEIQRDPPANTVCEADALLDAAVAAFLGQQGDAGARLATALAANPQSVTAQCLAGFSQMLAARRPLAAEAGRSLDRARAAFADHGGTAQDVALIGALELWHGQGDMTGCAARLEAAVAERPLDVLALRLSHAVRFMLGDAPAMRRVLEAALPAWNADLPAYPYVLGCYAFALGETGDLARAEQAGRDAVAMQPGDLWGAHAVAHAMGGLGRPRDGVAWIAGLEPQLAGGGSFVRHVHWHRALCHLRLGEPEAALDLYDRRVRSEPSAEVRDILNAASLLWRLEAAGLAAGARWEVLADSVAERVGDHAWAFADLHYVLCLAAAGRRDALGEMLTGIAARADRPSDTQSRVYAEVGFAAARAIRDLMHGAPASAARLFAETAPQHHWLGGSNAQRDLLRQMRQAAERQSGAATRRAAAAPAARPSPVPA